jgi:hypothetical protein
VSCLLLQMARGSVVACGKCILPRFAACSRNEESAGKRVTGTRAVNARWEWMCGERCNLLAAR